VSIVLTSWKKSTLIGLLVNMAHSSFSFPLRCSHSAMRSVTSAPHRRALLAGIMLANIAEIVSMPIIAKYSDRFGRRPFIIGGIVLMAIWFPTTSSSSSSRAWFSSSSGWWFRLVFVTGRCSVRRRPSPPNCSRPRCV